MLSLKGRGYFISIHSLYSVVHGKSGKEKIEAKTKKMLVAIMIVLCFYKTLYIYFTPLTMLTQYQAI